MKKVYVTFFQFLGQPFRTAKRKYRRKWSAKYVAHWLLSDAMQFAFISCREWKRSRRRWTRWKRTTTALKHKRLNRIHYFSVALQFSLWADIAMRWNACMQYKTILHLVELWAMAVNVAKYKSAIKWCIWKRQLFPHQIFLWLWCCTFFITNIGIASFSLSNNQINAAEQDSCLADVFGFVFSFRRRLLMAYLSARQFNYSTIHVLCISRWGNLLAFTIQSERNVRS